MEQKPVSIIYDALQALAMLLWSLALVTFLFANALHAQVSYTPLKSRVWTTYLSKDSIKDVGVEGQLERFQPVLPVTAWYDLVAMFVPTLTGTYEPGKALAYLGSKLLNSYPVIVEALTAPGNGLKVISTSASYNFNRWTVKRDTVTLERLDSLTRANVVNRVNSRSHYLRVLAPMQTVMRALPLGTVQLSGGSTTIPARATWVDNAPGRIASHGVGFGSTHQEPGPGGVLMPGYHHLWVRQFIKATSNWTTLSNVGGQGAPDHKTMFLRYFNSSARHEVKLGTTGRQFWHEGGNGGITLVSQGTLPITNVKSINEIYHTSGYPMPDSRPIIKVPCFPSQAPCGLGNGEWYEFIIHHKTIGERGEFTIYWRRFTVGDTLNPQPWKIHGVYMVGQPGQLWRPVITYVMGVNRNRQWDEDMKLFWGPYEIVDGNVYNNPWGLPQ